MKLFSIEEANEILPRIRMKLDMIRLMNERVNQFKSDAKAAAAVADRGGGMAGGSHYVTSLFEIAKLSSEIVGSGIQIKNIRRGLIDAPMLAGGRIVLLCWQFGEPDHFSWWHETDAGFAGRKPLEALFLPENQD